MLSGFSIKVTSGENPNNAPFEIVVSESTNITRVDAATNFAADDDDGFMILGDLQTKRSGELVNISGSFRDIRPEITKNGRYGGYPQRSVVVEDGTSLPVGESSIPQ